MNKKVNLAFALLVAASIGLTLNACKKTTDPDPGTTVKTLNKTLLVGKKWYDDPGTEVLDIRAGGMFSTTGTWRWVNNSDTFEFDLDGSGSVHAPVKLKIHWNTDTEMEANRPGDDKQIYKDHPW